MFHSRIEPQARPASVHEQFCRCEPCRKANGPLTVRQHQTLTAAVTGLGAVAGGLAMLLMVVPAIVDALRGAF